MLTLLFLEKMVIISPDIASHAYAKQVNHVNIFAWKLDFLLESIMKYNSFVNPFISCKTDIIVSNNTL